MFRGANKLTLDAKGRMVMPTRYRERLQERCGGKLVVTVDKDQCLLIYPTARLGRDRAQVDALAHAWTRGRDACSG